MMKVKTSAWLLLALAPALSGAAGAAPVAARDIENALAVVNQHCGTNLTIPPTFDDPEKAGAAIQAMAKAVLATQASGSQKGEDSAAIEQANNSWAENAVSLLVLDPAILDGLAPLTRQRIADCAARALRVAERPARIATAEDPGSQTAADAAAKAEPARKAAVALLQQVALNEPEFSLFIGPNFSLDGEGGWKAGGGDAVMRFDAGAKSFLGGRSFTELSYQKLEAIDEKASDEEKTEALKNPFASEQGFFRLNSGVIWPGTGRRGFLVSAGLTSVDSGSEDDDGSTAKVEPRFSAGMHSRTFFSEATYSQLFIGYAYDQFWEYDEQTGTDAMNKPVNARRKEFDRAIVDGTLYLPQVGDGKVRGALRLFVDTPISGHGPSDIRVSVLVFVPVNNFLAALNPLVGK